MEPGIPEPSVSREPVRTAGDRAPAGISVCITDSAGRAWCRRISLRMEGRNMCVFELVERQSVMLRAEKKLKEAVEEV